MIKINGQDEGLVINNDDFANIGALASLKSLINVVTHFWVPHKNMKKIQKKYT
jgi:hypothetical protein